MSRRLRIEKIKERQLNVDLEEEEGKLKLQQEKIYGPIVWRRLHSGFRIQDLKPKYYEEVLDMIEQYFVPEDVIFKNSRFSEDKVSQKSFRERLLFNMKDRCSIIAIEERRICKKERLEALECSCHSMNTEMEDVLAGALLLKTLKKCDMGRVFSRIQLTEGKPYQSIINFMNYMNKKVDLFDQFECDIYLRYYLLCIKPEHRRKGLGYQLMNVGLDIARHLNIPVVMGIFDCFKLQKLAKMLNMQTVYEKEYVEWIDKSGELVFCEPGVGNYSCAVMAGTIPPPPEPEPAPIEEEEVNSKLTRAEKRKKSEKHNPGS